MATATIPQVTKQAPLNPCVCEECCECDVDGQPIEYFKYQRVFTEQLGQDGQPTGRKIAAFTETGEPEFVAIDGSAFRKTFKARHWYCQKCSQRYLFPNLPGGHHPEKMRQKVGGDGVVYPLYFCSECA